MNLNALIIEDCDDDACLMARQLQQGGIDCNYVRVDNQEDMTRELKSSRWDIVICDYALPGFSGLAALKLVRQMDPEMPFIMVSGVAGEEFAIEVMHLGAQDYISKTNMARLAPAICRELREAEIRRQKIQAEDKVVQTAAHLRALLENISSAVVVFDRQLNVYDCNARAQEVFLVGQGESFAQVFDSAQLRLICEKKGDLTLADWPVQEVFDTCQAVRNRVMGLCYLHSQAPIWGLVSAVPLPAAADSEQLVLMTFLDITERKNNEKERERFINELEAKNAELERFTYTVSHDLRTPLITISGFAETLREDALAGNTSKLEEDIAFITNAAGKMHRLLNELLDLSRIGRIVNPSEQTELKEIAADALALIGGELAHGKPWVRIAEDLPVVYGDRNRLVEVMLNLITNAIKYMGGQSEPTIEIGMEDRDGLAVYYVRDNGTGIAPHYHKKVFDLFEQLDVTTEGTGVGLAIVKRIIELHQGRIWVESTGPGQGSTFCFTLGLAQEPPQPAIAPSSEPPRVKQPH